jgi:hypothetical protein
MDNTLQDDIGNGHNVCYLARLPVEMQEHIVSYLQNDVITPNYEPDPVFKDRMRATFYKNMIMKDEKSGNDNNVKVAGKHLAINQRGSLEYKDLKSKKKKKIIVSNIDTGSSGTVRNDYLYRSGLLSPKNIVTTVALSPNNQYFIALVDNNALRTFSIEGHEDRRGDFALEDYYSHEGLVPHNHLYQDWEENQLRGYISDLAEYDAEGNKAGNFLINQPALNPVRLVAISDDGEFRAFANDRQVFVQYGDEYKKIYELPLKYIDATLSKLFPFKRGMFRALSFNKQGTAVGILHHGFYNELPDKGDQQGDVYAAVRADLTQKIKEHSSDKYADLFNNQRLTYVMIRRNPKLFSAIFKEVAVVNVKKAKLSLADYFRMRGVCKDWYAQMG